MPTLLSQDQVKLEWSDVNNRKRRKDPKPHKRSNGVHLSGVTQYVMRASGLMTPRDETDEYPLCMAVGLAWEAWAVGLYPKMRWQPGEVWLDGVVGSPDGVTGTMLEEFKATWKSNNPQGKYGKILEQKMWMWQLMGYCHMLDLTTARIHVLWMNGQYPLGAPSPVYMTYTIAFTTDELEKFWRLVVLKNKDKATPEKH